MVKAKLLHLPVGTRWNDADGNHYEVSGTYTYFSKCGYHVKLNGIHLKDENGGIRYVPEAEVIFMRSKKV